MPANHRPIRIPAPGTGQNSPPTIRDRRWSLDEITFQSDTDDDSEIPPLAYDNNGGWSEGFSYDDDSDTPNSPLIFLSSPDPNIIDIEPEPEAEPNPRVENSLFSTAQGHQIDTSNAIRCNCYDCEEPDPEPEEPPCSSRPGTRDIGTNTVVFGPGLDDVDGEVARRVRQERQVLHERFNLYMESIREASHRNYHDRQRIIAHLNVIDQAAANIQSNLRRFAASVRNFAQIPFTWLYYCFHAFRMRIRVRRTFLTNRL